MRLADLKADLAEGEREWFPRLDGKPGLEPSGAISPAWVVARRVADLYDQCPECEGSGHPILYNGDTIIIEGGGIGPVWCPRCGGTGVVPGERWLRLWGQVVPLGPTDLARYLFGEGT